MKILRNAEFDYSSNNVSEINGYKKWYHWNIVKKHTCIINRIIVTILIISSFLFRQALRDMIDITSLIFIVLGCTAFWLLVITPIHEILHLIPLSNGVLDNKCIITVGHGTVSAFYNGYTNLYQQLISSILPFVVFLILLGLGAIFTTDVIRIIFLYLLILSSYGSYTDIYMFFYCMKHIGKNDIIFGLYKKES